MYDFQKTLMYQPNTELILNIALIYSLGYIFRHLVWQIFH